MAKTKNSGGTQAAKHASETQKSSPDAAAQDGKPSVAKGAPAKKRTRRRRKAVGIGRALRLRGFDEHAIADNYIEVTERLKGKSDKSGSVEKLLVDVLKECSKYIEPARPADQLRQAPVHIHLVHNVTRPARIVPPASAPVLDVAPSAETATNPASNASSTGEDQPASTASGDAGIPSSDPGAAPQAARDPRP